MSELLYILKCYFRHKFFGMSMGQLHLKVFRRVFEGRSMEVFEVCMRDYRQRPLEDLYYEPAYQRLLGAQRDGHVTAIISSSTDFIVRPFARRLQVDDFFTTEYSQSSNGRMDGLVRLVRGREKAEILLQLAKKHSVPLENVTAYSDSHLDLPFLEAAGTAVAVNPDRKLRSAARDRGWEII